MNEIRVVQLAGITTLELGLAARFPPEKKDEVGDR
jgi:hypothetical protein